MKKWGLPLFAAVMLVLSMIVSFTGCSSDDDPPVAPTPVVDSGPPPAPTTTTPTPVTPPPNPTGSGATQTKAITNAGGGVAVGNLTVDVPAGALPATTNITVTESSQPVPPPHRAVTPLYIFTPEGLTFNSPVTISIRYTGNTAGLSIFYSRLNDPTKYDPIGTTFTDTAASAQVTHFSSAFIGYLPGFPDAGTTCAPTSCGATPASGQACTPCSTPCNFATALCMCSNNQWACTNKSLPPDAGAADAGEEAGSKGTTATPTSNPPAGNYTTILDVSLATTTPGAEIYYTLDGTTPTILSSFYMLDQPLRLTATTTIKFFARAAGFDPSPVVTKLYTISLSAAAPTITPVGGSYSGPQTITLATTTQGATIHYTTDGSNPTAQSATYTGPFTLSQSATVKAIAVKAGIGNSLLGAAGYVITLPQAAQSPVFSPNGGVFAGPTSVTITSPTPNAVVHFTVDGSPPTVNSPIASGPIAVAATQTIRAIAVAAGFANSPVASATFDITTTVSPPAFSPTPGPFTGSALVTITTGTSGAVIRYTTDGSTPTASSTIYSVPVSISATTTFKAFASKSGLSDSIVTTGTYTLTLPTPAPPTFSPAGGTFTTSQSVSISSAAGTQIHFTTNGQTPTTSSQIYGGPISLTQTTTVNAIAVAGGVSSSVASATFSLDASGGTVAAPSISPAGGTYTNSVDVTLTSNTPGATVHCTTNGTTPTAQSQTCSTIAVTASSTINAVAVLNGVASSVNSAAFTIQVGKPTFTPTPGTFAGAQSVTLSSATQNAAIYYKVINLVTCGAACGDMTVSDANTLYIGPIAVSQNTRINAFAKKPGLLNSEVSFGTYTIGQPTALTPSITPSPGTYSTAQMVTISTSMGGSQVRYTTNGSDPKTPGNAAAVTSTGQSTTPFRVPATGTPLPATVRVRAYAFATGFNDSPEVFGDYTISPSAMDPPTATPPAGTYAATQTVTLVPPSYATPPGSTIQMRYTVNGDTPTTTSGTLYAGPFTVASSTDIRAIAYLSPGLTPSSSIVTFSYTITPPRANQPTFTGNIPTTSNPLQAGNGFSYPGSVQVSLATSETPAATATIHYVICPNTPPVACADPTSASQNYTGPFTLNTTSTVKAITTQTGAPPKSASLVTIGEFTVLAQAAAPTFNPPDGDYPTPAFPMPSNTLDVTVSTTTPSATLRCTYGTATAIPPDPCTAANQRAGYPEATTGCGGAGQPTCCGAGGGPACCTAPSPACLSPLVVSSTRTVVKAIATEPTLFPSSVSTARYDLLTDNPVFSQAGGVFSTPLANSTVTITSPNATAIRCTVTNNLTPGPAPASATAGDPCDGIGPITSTKTIVARAFRTNFEPSVAVTQTYQFRAATPTFNPGPGTGQARAVVLACPGTDGQIYYTTAPHTAGGQPQQPATPSTSTSQYIPGTTNLVINESTTIRAICVKTGFDNSLIAGGIPTDASTIAPGGVFTVTP